MQTATTQLAHSNMHTSTQTGKEILNIENVCRGFRGLGRPLLEAREGGYVREHPF